MAPFRRSVRSASTRRAGVGSSSTPGPHAVQGPNRPSSAPTAAAGVPVPQPGRGAHPAFLDARPHFLGRFPSDHGPRRQGRGPRPRRRGRPPAMRPCRRRRRLRSGPRKTALRPGPIGCRRRRGGPRCRTARTRRPRPTRDARRPPAAPGSNGPAAAKPPAAAGATKALRASRRHDRASPGARRRPVDGAFTRPAGRPPWHGRTPDAAAPRRQAAGAASRPAWRPNAPLRLGRRSDAAAPRRTAWRFRASRLPGRRPDAAASCRRSPATAPRHVSRPFAPPRRGRPPDRPAPRRGAAACAPQASSRRSAAREASPRDPHRHRRFGR